MKKLLVIGIILLRTTISLAQEVDCTVNPDDPSCQTEETSQVNLITETSSSDDIEIVEEESPSTTESTEDTSATTDSSADQPKSE